MRKSAFIVLLMHTKESSQKTTPPKSCSLLVPDPLFTEMSTQFTDVLLLAN